MIGVLKTIVIFLVFYYLFRILFRLFMPFAMKKGMENMEKQFRKAQNQTDDTGEVGETVIDTKPRKSSSSKEKEGEYIDYEEID